MLYQIKSSKPLDDIQRDLSDSAARHKFGVLTVHDLRETMKKKEVDLDMDCRIFEICNPHQAKRVLESEGAISTALPCRISVYGHPGQYTIATMLPTEMMKSFDAPAVATVAREVEDVIKSIMSEAAQP
jgi:uncharacterized protein (DUF302 family)